MRTKRTHKTAGFTLLELLVVMVIILIVAAMAIPNVLASIDNVRLRGTASNVSGLMQSARQLAIKDNRFYTCRGTPMGTAFVAFIDSVGTGRADGSGNGTYDPPRPAAATLTDQKGEQVVQIPANIQFDSSGANPAFPGTALIGPTFAPQPATTMPSFNARGLPCVMNGAQCRTTTPAGAPVSFLYFLRMDAGSGVKWAAVSVTPAGRVRVWMWSGRVWS